MKFRLMIMILSISTILTGCWDLVEVKDRSIISAFGIDKSEEDGKMILTLQTIIPSKISTPAKSSAETKPTVRVVVKTAESLSEALKNYAMQSERETYLMQNRIIIIGEDVAREGLAPIMDFFMRHINSYQGAWILICKGKASDILKWNSDVERIPADFIVGLIKTRNYLSSSSVEDVHSFVRKISSKSTSPATSLIGLTKADGVSNEARLHDIGVFKKDKMVGVLEGIESAGYAWINNEQGRRLFEIDDTPTANIKTTNQIDKSKTTIVPEIINGKLVIFIKVTATARVYINSGNIDLNSKENLENLGDLQSEAIKEEIEACVNKVQKEYKTDIFGFGEKIHRKYPQEWKTLEKNWEDVFPDLTFMVDVKVKIRQTGLILDTIKPK